MMGGGLLIVDKPEGMTSAEAVRVVKRALGCKTGHLGTLDPFASGVLPLCLDEGTKIAQFLNDADKEYQGLIRLGSETDTGDPTGRVLQTAPVPPLTPQRLEEVARRFRGAGRQTPPMYSAIKRQGTPLYKLARQGIAVEREPRAIHIAGLELRAGGADAVAFSMACSKGTYVRVLAQEIAVALGTLGHLESLRRTRFGPFTLADAVRLEALPDGGAPVIGLREALPHVREIQLDAAAAVRARQGYAPVLDRLPPGRAEEAAKLIAPDGALAAVVVADGCGRWRFARVFTPAPRACA